ncbi:hypothetical protein ACFWP0_09055 [Achromobacter sp. NPDC058515]|uniref:glycine-rich domain-containing protein n=1 Tax=Achromobacter sp. NPDC058515 TaxID=3346533 RepID=UPI00365276C1
MATRIYKTPFAATGDKEALATADQPDGKVSLQAGWTPDYELPNDNPNYRPVGRAEMNGVINELTLALGEMQLHGFAKWQTIDGGWPLAAYVSHNGVVYRSTADSNTVEPAPGISAWSPLPTRSGAAMLASYATAGTFSFTVPAGVYRILAEGWGGGGGGGAGGGLSSGNGAGSGAYGLKWIDVTPGQVISIVVGAAGAAGPSAGIGGGAGGASSVGAFMSIPGGAGGAGGGTGGGIGGAAATGADFTIPGNNGVGPSISNASGTLVYGWPGGSAPRGASNAPGPGIAVGQQGRGAGCGGGGGAGGSSTQSIGGAGVAGQVLIWG